MIAEAVENQWHTWQQDSDNYSANDYSCRGTRVLSTKCSKLMNERHVT